MFMWYKLQVIWTIQMFQKLREKGGDLQEKVLNTKNVGKLTQISSLKSTKITEKYKHYSLF